MHDIFYDAWRFISRCFAIIQRSALHTYYSALPFTPTKSALCKYHKDLIHHLCELDGVAEQWDALIASGVVGDYIDHIVFSANNSQLACLTERELNLLDATSG